MLEFLAPLDESCSARLNMQLACKALRDKVKNTPCYRERRNAKVMVMPAAQRDLCANWLMSGRLADDATRDDEGAGHSEDFPPYLWSLSVPCYPDSSLPRLPPGLKRLVIFDLHPGMMHTTACPDAEKPDLHDFPSSLESLNIFRFDAPLFPGMLPTRLTSLDIRIFNRQLSPGDLPPRLRRLTLTHFNQPIRVGDLPASLRSLTLPWFNEPLEPSVLPNGLRVLSLRWFNHALQPGVIPSTLSRLELGSYSSPFYPGVLPHGLNHIKCRAFPGGLDLDQFRSGLRNDISELENRLAQATRRIEEVEAELTQDQGGEGTPGLRVFPPTHNAQASRLFL